MAMSLSSSLTSQIPSGSHHLSLDTYANTLCIPRFFGILSAGTIAGKRRSFYLRWGEGSNKIIACVGEGTAFLPYQSAGKTAIAFDVVLSKIGRESRFLYLMDLTGRLVNDTKTYEAERGQGEVASAIQCYMKDHPEISEEVALKHGDSIMENALDELNWEFVNNREVPESCRRLIFESARIMQLFYMEGDRLTLSHDMEIKEHVKNCLFRPAA